MARVKKDAPDQASTTLPALDDLSFQERLAIGLDRLKTERGTTARQLAEELGMSETYMSNLMRGDRDVKLTTLDKMTRVWNVTIEDLFNVTDEDIARFEASKARRKTKKGSSATD